MSLNAGLVHICIKHTCRICNALVLFVPLEFVTQLELLCAALPPPLEYRLTMNEVFDERGRPQLERLRAHLASEGLLTEEAALRIIHDGAALLRNEPTVLEVEAPITGAHYIASHHIARASPLFLCYDAVLLLLLLSFSRRSLCCPLSLSALHLALNLLVL